MTEDFPDSLDHWLSRIERQHPVEIDMGLDRVRQVHGRLGLPVDRTTAISVAGTNGKGSCVAYLESIYEAAGYRTGVYTSPHLQQFNERIRVGGEAVADTEIVAAFMRIESALMDVTLTYFEYSTLAALLVFQRRDVEVYLLEVGMGGRLDAVNLVNAAVSVVTSIGLDHQAWLGDTREAIGAEKAGVFRRGQAAVIGDDNPPRSLAKVATETGARLLCIGRDFSFSRDVDTWSWRGSISGFDGLPLPRFGGREQFNNAACALAAVEQLGLTLRTDREDIIMGLQRAYLPGRLQHVRGQRNWILDVAHNGDAARSLAHALQGFAARTIAVVGMMRDKPVEAVGLALDEVVDEWIVVDSGSQRSLPVADLVSRLAATVTGPVSSATSLTAGLSAAVEKTVATDRILVTGSFTVVGPALAHLSRHA